MIWLGFVAVFGAWVLWRNHQRLHDFEGESSQYTSTDGRGQRYELSQANVGKTGILRKIGVHCPQWLEFDLSHEDIFSRFLERLAIGREILTRDRRFDRTYTVQSEDPRVAPWLQQSAAARRHIDSLFREGARRVIAHGGRIWIEIHRPGDRIKASQAELKRVADQLHGLAASVPAADENRQGAPDRWWARAMLPLFLSNGALALCIGYFLSRPFQPYPAHLSAPDVYETLAPFSLVITLALVWTCAWWIKDSARARVVLRELLLIGMPCLFIAGLLLATDLNVALAPGPVEIRDAKVVSTAIEKTRRSRSYFLFLEQLDPDQPHGMRLKVSKVTYDGAQVDRPVRIRWQRGALGFPFVLAEPELISAP